MKQTIARLATTPVVKAARQVQANALLRIARERARDYREKPFPDPCDDLAARTLVGVAVMGLPHARRAELLRELARLLEFADETPAGGVS